MTNTSWIKPVTIGKTITDNNIFLAPMAGSTEISFRNICHRLGAGLTVTELVTARGIRYQKSIDKNFRYLEISPDYYPQAIQLFGSDPIDFARAIETIFKHPLLSGCSAIDINMGCPVMKVIKTGSGSALMKTPEIASEIIKASVKESPVPVTVKIRKGWNEFCINAVDFAKMCEDSGASMITVHGRTSNQMYNGKADWNIIAKVKEAVKVPVIGNGDVVSPGTARAMFEQTNADGVMVGRGAHGNPWIFSQILSVLRDGVSPDEIVKPSLEERVFVMREHFESALVHMDETVAVREMRKHFAWYLKGIPHVSTIKSKLMQCNSKEEINSLFDELLALK